MPNPGDREARGPYSSMLRAAGNFAGTVGAAIPSLSAVTGPTDWFLRNAARAVSAFGYSKPAEPQKPTRNIPMLTSNQHNCDGYEVPLNLGFTADTKVGAMTLAGIDMDEMTFDFIKQVETRFAVFMLATTTGRDALLWSIDHSPAKLHDTESVADFRAATAPMFLANFGKYWRGDLVLRFKAVRTRFHGAKLLVGFIPHNSDNDTVPSVADALDYHSVVWDLSAVDEIEFAVPYTSNKAWSNFDDDNGQIFVSVIAPMVCPSNVAQQIPIEVSVRCADNFAVAGYGMAKNTSPVHRYGTFAGSSPLGEAHLSSSSVLVTQAAPLPYTTLSHEDAELYCIGNAMRSLKQILNVGMRMDPKSVASYPPGDGKFTDHVYDWLLTTEVSTTSSTNIPHALIAPMYALWRGGWVLTATVPDNAMLEVSLNPYTTVTGKDIVTAVVPYTAAFSRSIWTDSKMQATVTTKFGQYLTVTGHAADDFQLGYFKYLPWLKIT